MTTTKNLKSRRARRLLNTHTYQGVNRHVKSAAYRDKRNRLDGEHSRGA